MFHQLASNITPIIHSENNAADEVLKAIISYSRTFGVSIKPFWEKWRFPLCKVLTRFTLIKHKQERPRNGVYHTSFIKGCCHGNRVR